MKVAFRLFEYALGKMLVVLSRCTDRPFGATSRLVTNTLHNTYSRYRKLQ